MLLKSKNKLSYLYGDEEGVRRFIPYLISKMELGENAELTSVGQIRDFMDVSDAGKEIVEFAISAHQGSVNICSGNPVTVS